MTVLVSAPASAPGSAPARRAGRTALVLTGLALALVLVAVLRLGVGGTAVGWPGGDLLALRAARLGLAVGAGVALALSGVALQALLRNPLAEPFILGLSSGASVGVMAQWLLAYQLRQVMGPSHFGALLGAAASMTIVFLAGRRHGMIDPLGLLLTGVVLGSINGALIMLLNYLLGPAGLREDLARWMMGYLHEDLSHGAVLLVGIVILAGLGLLLAQARAMDVASFSDTEAISLGVHLPLLRALLFATASVLAAAGVVLAGPIAFVGLICPHVARLLLGPRHRALLVASALLGAILILLADMASALLALTLHIGMMPIGVFTALLGGPVFLWMLRPQLGRGTE